MADLKMRAMGPEYAAKSLRRPMASAISEDALFTSRSAPVGEGALVAALYAVGLEAPPALEAVIWKEYVVFDVKPVMLAAGAELVTGVDQTPVPTR